LVTDENEPRIPGTRATGTRHILFDDEDRTLTLCLLWSESRDII